MPGSMIEPRPRSGIAPPGVAVGTGGAGTATVGLVEIGPENWRDVAALAVAREQRGWVADPVTCLARAYAYREHAGRARCIVVARCPVGLVMTRVWERRLVLEELLIDAREQGQGVGGAVIDEVVAEARRAGFEGVNATVVATNTPMLGMLTRRGFARVPDCDDGDELALVLHL